MKKTVVVLFSIGLFTLQSCSKEAGNKNVIKAEDHSEHANMDKALVPGSNTYTYRGLEGVRAKVIFSNTDTDKSVTIQANNNRFQLDKKSEENGVVHYERAGITAEAKGDSLIIHQDGNEIPLACDN